MSKKNLIACIITTTIVLIMFGAYFSGAFKKETTPTEIIVPETSRQYIGDLVEYNGHVYQYNNNLINILFLGIDTTDTLNKFSEPTHAGQSDAIVLLTLNRTTREVRVLQINRNTMVDVDIYNSDGQIVRTQEAQITLQYAAGTGGTQSVWASKSAVSELLYNLPIDYYFVMNMNGIDTINDAVGGVDITMPRDYTMIDRNMTRGRTVHITGNTATRFVRYRDIDEFNSVADRMERQVLYITALMDKLAAQGEYGMYNVLYPYINDIILTNLDATGVASLIEYNYQNCQVDYLPGEMIMGDQYEEFYVNSDLLHEYVITNFYVIKE